ncbi:hypothetical protein ACROYT_G003674 [Oculina patagonica]
MLDSFRDRTSIKIEALHKEAHHLTIWANQLDQTYKYLQKKGNKLDTRLAGLRKEIERAEEELRRRQIEYDNELNSMYISLI